MIKKIALVLLLMIILPYIIVTIFIQNKEIIFEFNSNMKVRVKKEATKEIVEVPFEQYITGVLAGEMPVSFNKEALKAQAVAARSYVMNKMKNNVKNDFDVVDTIMNQVYLDEEYLKKAWGNKYVENINKIKTVILETSGEYLEYDGKIVEAFFFSTSVGATENSVDVFTKQLPYLVSVSSTWDEATSPIYNDTFTFTLEEFYNKLSLPFKEKITTETIKKTSTGRIKELKINGTKFSAGTVLEKLKLRSTFFTITQEKNKVIVNTKGYGHGVGMSQYGAEGMARNGYKYDQILKHYYQGTEIKKI